MKKTNKKVSKREQLISSLRTIIKSFEVVNINRYGNCYNFDVKINGVDEMINGCLIYSDVDEMIENIMTKDRDWAPKDEYGFWAMLELIDKCYCDDSTINSKMEYLLNKFGK